MRALFLSRYRMKHATFFPAILLAATAWAQAPKDIPLITNGSVTVTSEDFDAFLLRAPEEHRPEIRASFERIGKAVDIVYTNRVVAEDAKRLGLDKDPLVKLRMQQILEGYLAQRWIENYRKTAKTPDLTARAEEIYKLNKQRFFEPDRIIGTHVLINLNGRTREAARALAEEIRAKAVAGADFEELATTYAADDRARRAKGRLAAALKDLEPPIADAIRALKGPGDITPVVEAPEGFHLVKLSKRFPARQRPFDEVKDGIIAEERDRLVNLDADRRIGELKNNAQTKVYEKNINALQVSMTPAELERAQLTPSTEPPPAR
jgi:peptidyl-prolyl cis-trans isomerase C